MKFIIVTGLSGAGKTQVVKAFEDMGDYCVDNMPPELIPKFAEIYHKGAEPDDCVALVCDIRGGDMFRKLSDSLDELAELGYEYEILFLDASDEVLIRRYKETRRIHPLGGRGRLTDGIAKERMMLAAVKEKAAKIIDTTQLSAAQLRQQIRAVYGKESKFGGMLVHVMSFGFKYGLPLDADLVFDVRFLPNPFYVPELKEHTGLEVCIRDFVMASEDSRVFLEKLTDLTEFLIPRYINEGKSQLVIGIGCTGGHHRSVTLAEALYSAVSNAGYNATVSHRDIKKGI
ncbi:MAG: RNase adapter RapZ [Clostridia bacterium]|nr:RNase adapter RapZ [Clostridia bacterium]